MRRPARVGWRHYTGHAAWLPADAETSPLWAWLKQQQLSQVEQQPPADEDAAGSEAPPDEPAPCRPVRPARAAPCVVRNP